MYDNLFFFTLTKESNKLIEFLKILHIKKTNFTLNGITLEYYSIFYIITNSFCFFKEELYNIDCFVDIAYCNTVSNENIVFIRKHFCNSLDLISLSEDLNIRSNIINSFSVLYNTDLIKNK